MILHCSTFVPSDYLADKEPGAVTVFAGDINFFFSFLGQHSVTDFVFLSG